MAYNSPSGELETLFISDYDIIDQFSTMGTLWLCGDNDYGSLGDGTIDRKSSPVQTVAGGINWKSVASGAGRQAAAIKTDGTLWTWGRNNSGQLGNNTVAGTSSPIQTAAGGTNWKLVTCGLYFTAAIKTNGELWSWGEGSRGQLGNNAAVNKSTPVQSTDGGTNWKSIASGTYHVAAIKNDGTLWTWGYNANGQLGDNTILHRSSPVPVAGGGTNWKLIGAGTYHTLAIKNDGTLWVWGHNNIGQLGDVTIVNKSTPIQIGTSTTWKQVTGGKGHTVAIKTDGTLWAWGHNTNGTLGDGLKVHRSSPFQIGTSNNWKTISGGYLHNVAIKTDGTLWAWGYNTYGQLGDNTISSRSSPVQNIALGNNWKSVGCGYNYTGIINYDN